MDSDPPPQAQRRCPPASTRPRAAPSDEHELDLIARGYRLIAGVDEAGRGALAGPVVAAAIILPTDLRVPALLDSKQLTASQRDTLFALLTASAASYGLGVVQSAEIDALNILRATHLAMRLALDALSPAPDVALVDGLPASGLPVPQQAVVAGDQHCRCIAAASILAKVTRDRIMCALDLRFAAYGFAQHKGYATRSHLAALDAHGPCEAHRHTFAPVRRVTQARLVVDL